ncbi:DNA cytosine methyltransferase [Viscerimonas tarda]
MTHGSLFSGIGGFDLAAQWCGWTNVFQCENDEFCRKVLKQNFTNIELYGDIKDTDFSRYKGTIDVVSGGFPCQPFSCSGRQRGTADNRYLWPEMFRAIRTIAPKWVVAENVCGILSISNGMVLEQVLSDLESEGYEVQTFVVPACGKNSFQYRKRVWIIASLGSIGMEANEVHPELINDTRQKAEEPGLCDASDCDNWIGTMRDSDRLVGKIYGISNWMDRVKGLGNAIDPRIAYQIYKVIDRISN